MVDFAIMKANKPIATPNFHVISPFIWQRSPEGQFFWTKIITKNYTFSSSIFAAGHQPGGHHRSSGCPVVIIGGLVVRAGDCRFSTPGSIPSRNTQIFLFFKIEETCTLTTFVSRN